MNGATLTPGQSDVAKSLDSELEEHRNFLQSSAAIGNERLLLGEFPEVWHECRQPDWDGYNAAAATIDSLTVALYFLLSLPVGIRLPTVGATPSGNFTFEWHHSRRRSLTVIVAEDGYIHYAALLGADIQDGKVAFFDEVPETILDLIAKVYEC
ncbi:MAG: hypothetical protein WDZ59_11840 [Pirellulales bacterium]